MRIADQLGVTCPVFYVDNVAHYYADSFRGDRRFNAATDAPCVASPFDCSFYEYTWPATTTEMVRAALLIEAQDVDIEVLANGAVRRCRREHYAVAWQQNIEGNDNGTLMTSNGKAAWHWLTDSDGRIVSISYRCMDGNKWTAGATSISAACTDSTPSAFRRNPMKHVAGPILLAISFMHCKNVRRVEHAEVRRSGKGWREAKPWKVRHYTLDIDPMREVLRTEGQSETVGLARALHICRGHFRTYTADKPLFGRGVGTVWVPSHTRGTIAAGAVVKDYSVKAPSHDDVDIARAPSGDKPCR